LQEGGAKKKACKKETPFSWALPTPAPFLKKEGQKLTHRVCANKAINQNLHAA
jgi:hypothetical protein